VHWMALSE